MVTQWVGYTEICRVLGIYIVHTTESMGLDNVGPKHDNFWYNMIFWVTQKLHRQTTKSEILKDCSGNKHVKIFTTLLNKLASLQLFFAFPRRTGFCGSPLPGAVDDLSI